MLARSGYDLGLKTKTVFLGKKSKNANLARVWRFSHFEGIKFQALLKQVLSEADKAFPRPGFGDKLIPFFDGKEAEAYMQPTKENRVAFWDGAHLNSANIKVRVTFSVIRGEFETRILSPVSSELVEQHKGMSEAESTNFCTFSKTCYCFCSSKDGLVPFCS